MVVTVSVDDFAEASVIEIDAGEKLVVASLDAPLKLSRIVPVNPPIGVAVMV